jgi:hypothetical protein
MGVLASSKFISSTSPEKRPYFERTHGSKNNRESTSQQPSKSLKDVKKTLLNYVETLDQCRLEQFREECSERPKNDDSIQLGSPETEYSISAVRPPSSRNKSQGLGTGSKISSGTHYGELVKVTCSQLLLCASCKSGSTCGSTEG